MKETVLRLAAHRFFNFSCKKRFSAQNTKKKKERNGKERALKWKKFCIENKALAMKLIPSFAWSTLSQKSFPRMKSFKSNKIS